MDPSKKLVLRWISIFFLCNVLILFFIQLSYLTEMPDLSTTQIHPFYFFFTWIFLIAAYLTQSTILNILWVLIAVILTLIFKKKSPAILFSIIMTALLLLAQSVDRIAYGLYNSHEFKMIWAIFQSGSLTQVIPISEKELFLLLAVAVVSLLLQSCLAYGIYCYFKKTSPTWVRYLYIPLIFATLISYGSLTQAFFFYEKNASKKNYSTYVLKVAKLVPYFTTIYKSIFPSRQYSFRTIQTSSGPTRLVTQPMLNKLNYPLHDLKSDAPATKINILWLVIDTLRYDTVSPKITPNIFHFAQDALVFNQHYSGGNCTLPGIFSLFYALPSNYWYAFLDQQKSPVFIDELQKNNYQMAILASAGLYFPQYHLTIFRKIDLKNPLMHSKNSKKRDEEITNKFIHFLDHHDQNRPFFGFLFYDAVHNYCEGDEHEFQAPFLSAVKDCSRFSLTRHSEVLPYLHRYNNAAHFVDQEIAKIIASLRAHQLLKNTLIIITSDHGESLNSEKLGYWTHASAFTSYQLHVPLIIYWPGKSAHQYNYLTSHYDIVPTLMNDIFHCRNSFSDYSTGYSLFDSTKRLFLIINSYSNYSIMTSDWIMKINRDGDYELNDLSGRSLQKKEIPFKILNQAYFQLLRFYK